MFPESKIILCQREINKKVVANCKPHFSKEDDWNEFNLEWLDLINSGTEEMLEEQLTALRTKYGDDHGAVKYVVNDWMPYKQYFIGCFIDSFAHFGSNTIARVKGAHNSMKNYVNFSNLTKMYSIEVVIWEFIGAMDIMLNHKRDDLFSEIVRNTLRLSPGHDIQLLSSIVCKVSNYALVKIKHEIDEMQKDNLETCTGHFSTVYGLPCRHRILEFYMLGEPIPISQIHQQWILDPTPHGICRNDCGAGSLQSAGSFPALCNVPLEVTCNEP